MFFRKTIISAPVIKSKTDKLKKRALRDARKQIKKGELIDSHSFALYLQDVTDRYTHLRTEIAHSTLVNNYAKLRSEKMAKTRQILSFFSKDYDELNRLHKIVSKKALQAQRTDEDWNNEPSSIIDLTKLKESFEKLEQEEKENVRKDK